MMSLLRNTVAWMKNTININRWDYAVDCTMALYGVPWMSNSISFQNNNQDNH